MSTKPSTRKAYKAFRNPAKYPIHSPQKKNPKDELAELYDVFSSNPDIPPEEAVFLMREHGEIYEPRYPLGAPLIPSKDKNTILDYLRKVKSYAVGHFHNNRVIAPLIEPVKKLLRITKSFSTNFSKTCVLGVQSLSKKVQSLSKNCQKNYDKYLVESSELIQQIKENRLLIDGLLNELKTGIKQIEKLIAEAIDEDDLDMKKILSTDDNDKTSIVYFALKEC
jgi:hypothetical protein